MDRWGGWGWFEKVKKETKKWVDKGKHHVEKTVSDWWHKVKDSGFYKTTIGTMEFGLKAIKMYSDCQVLTGKEKQAVLLDILNDAKTVIKPLLEKKQLGSNIDELKALFDRHKHQMLNLVHCMDAVLPHDIKALSLSLSIGGSK